MDIILHVGPHKSGTTSIQTMLCDLFGSDAPQPIWYPTVPDVWHNVSHAPLAMRFAKTHGTFDLAAGLGALQQILSLSEPCDTLVLSSENFSFVAPDELRRLREALNPHRLHVVFTASPYAIRALAFWTTKVRFGHIRPFRETVPELVKANLFRADFFQRMIQGLSPDQTSLIVSDKRDSSERLLQDFLAACGLESYVGQLEESHTRRRNVSPKYWEIEAILAMNSVYQRQNIGKSRQFWR